jgi:hypothetical protein
MSYKYQIKSGNEERVFAGQGVRNLGNGIVESDQELDSPLLEAIEDKPEQMTASTEQKPAAAANPIAPALPVQPPQNTQPQGGIN